MAVLMYDTSGAQDVCINKFLVQNGYCQTAGLGYAFHYKTVTTITETCSLMDIGYFRCFASNGAQVRHFEFFRAVTIFPLN